jgi:hypothetical protein
MTWCVTQRYYKQNAEDLKKVGEILRTEAARLHRAISTIAYLLENKSPNLHFKNTYDGAGNLIGVAVTATGSSVAPHRPLGLQPRRSRVSHSLDQGPCVPREARRRRARAPAGGQPLFSLDVVLLKANPQLSKLYYSKAYAEGDDGAPDCSSANGITPDSGVPNPQSASCAGCPQNVWGSKITPQGTKTKACADMRRLAVVPERDIACQTWGARSSFASPLRRCAG